MTQVENIVKFLNKNSQYGKNVHEIEEISQNLSATIYKVVG